MVNSARNARRGIAVNRQNAQSFGQNLVKIVKNKQKSPENRGFSLLFRLAFLYKRQFVVIFTNFKGNLTLFIGDFDIEYLLNSRGNLRLKAYNHFNDQNYFIRNALTTQGVGIVFRHEFDKLFRKRTPKSKPQASGDSVRQSTKKSSTVSK